MTLQPVKDFSSQLNHAKDKILTTIGAFMPQGIDIEEDGTVSAVSGEGMQLALDAVRALTEEVEVGRIYTGTVRRLVDFGAFVEILPDKEGLVRTSQLADYQVMRPEDVVSVGDEITVMVVEVDPRGRINLSRRAALSGEMPSASEMESDRAGRGSGRGGAGRPGGYGGGRQREGTMPGRGYGERGGNSGYGGQRRPMGPGRGPGGSRREGGYGQRPPERRW